MTDERLLDVEDLSVSYGRIAAVRNFSFHVGPGEIVALLGPNGAGKSSTIKALVGLTAATGRIVFSGQAISTIASRKRASLGIAYSPEGRRVFGDMTVHENLQLGGYLVTEGLKDRIDEVYRIFPRLWERRQQVGATLSGGEQQMLSIGRALISNPRLLILDEPSLGLAPIMVSVIYQTIVAIRARGTAILVSEQSARLALALADRAYLLESGSMVVSGRADELRDQEAIAEAYLGKVAEQSGATKTSANLD